MVSGIHCAMVIGGLITMVSMVIIGLITAELYNNDHRTLETFHSDSDFNTNPQTNYNLLNDKWLP